MPAITLPDLNNAKLDVDHIAAIATSTELTATDRLGQTKRTLKGQMAAVDAELASKLDNAQSQINVKVNEAAGHASDSAASASEALGYLQTIRATSYGAYASDPATDPLGSPPTVGDEYFNTTANLLKRWNGTTWQASDINTANLAASSGSSLVGYDGGTVQDVLDGAVSRTDYADLRAYTGRAKRIYITGILATVKPSGIAGVFQYDVTDTTSADNGGTIIVGADGRRWKRDFTGAANVAWFEAVGDGITQSSNQILSALAAHNSIEFDEGSYYLGEYNSSADKIFQIHNTTKTLKARGRVEFVIRTVDGTGDCFPTVFDLYNCDWSKFDHFHFRDLGYNDSTGNRRGLKAYRLTSDAASGSWGEGVTIEAITAQNCIAPITFEGGNSADRVRGVTVGPVILDNTYYGLNCVNNGDSLKIGPIISDNVRRVYFVYGVKNHDVTIFDKNPKGSTGTVNISRSAGGLNTESLRVRYVCRESTIVNQLYVLINHIDLLGGSIRDIDLDLSIDVDVTAVPVRFVNYDGAGIQTNAASLNIVYGIKIRGLFGPTCTLIDTIAAYSTKGSLIVDAIGAGVFSSTRSAFQIPSDSGSWTPVLADDTLSSSEGQTASLAIGSYYRSGNVVHFTGRLRMTSLGSLNVTAAAAIIGLPYVSGNVSSRHSSVNIGLAANLNLSAAAGLSGYVPENASRINITKFSSTTGTKPVAVSEFGNGGEVSFSGFYFV